MIGATHWTVGGFATPVSFSTCSLKLNSRVSHLVEIQAPAMWALRGRGLAGGRLVQVY